MKLPEVRAELMEIAKEVEAYGFNNDWLTKKMIRVHQLAKETKRRSPVRVARKTPTHLTLRQKMQILRRVDEEPDTKFDEIGRPYGVDGGRVSEIVAGYRV